MGLWLTVVYVLAVLLAFWSWLWAARTRTRVPGPRTLPLLGNALDFWKTPVVVGHFRALHRQYGDVFRIYLGPKLFLVVTRPEDVQTVLTVSKCRDQYCAQTVRSFIGDGLVTNFGTKWKSHRRAIEPAFRQEVIEKYANTINDAAKFVCERLEKSIGSEHDVYSLLLQGSLRSIFPFTFGVNFEDLIPNNHERDELSEFFVFALKFLQKRIVQPWMYLDWTLILTADGRKFRRVNEIYNNLIRRATEAASHVPLNEKPNQRISLRDVLVGHNGGRKIPAEDVHDEACTLVLAGSDTTSATMAYVLSVLGLYPEWQERAVRELEDVYGKCGDYKRPSTMDDLRQLVVLESIIKETMRLFPVGPIVPHKVLEDVPLDGGQYTAPRGTCVVIAYSLLHRQLDSFTDPYSFDPGRFLEGGSATGRHPYSYLPFGGGPRKCIGARYGMIQSKIFLSALLRHFRILPVTTRDELEEVVLSITGHPVMGYRVKCLLRDTNPQHSSV